MYDMYEYGTLKTVEAILRGGGGRRRIMEGTNQTGIHYMHMRKCHSNPPCTTINKKKNTFKRSQFYLLKYMLFRIGFSNTVRYHVTMIWSTTDYIRNGSPMR
jgi:hypothetical protein